MSDPYRINQASDSTPAESATPPVRPAGRLRPVLWVLLIVSAAANAGSSAAGLHPVVSITFGVLALACVAALITGHYRRRRS